MSCQTVAGNAGWCVMLPGCPAVNGASSPISYALFTSSTSFTCYYVDGSSAVAGNYYLPMEPAGGMTNDQYLGLKGAIDGTTNQVALQTNAINSGATGTQNAVTYAASGQVAELQSAQSVVLAIALLCVFLVFTVLGYRIGKRKGDM